MEVQDEQEEDEEPEAPISAPDPFDRNPNRESSFLTSLPSQAGQLTSVKSRGKIVSNSFPQPRHSNSKIGIRNSLVVRISDHR